MVYLTRFLLRKAFSKRKGFVDSLRLTVRGGAGGSGIPKYGGLGGSGGSVYVVAKNGITLSESKKKYKEKKLQAGTGTNSSKAGLIGQPGTDLNIMVPPGVTVLTDDGVNLGEVDEEGAKVLAAKGGLGGCPETQFCGQKGQIRTIILDLKLIADVGLVGFPNAGKSTFLKAISSAKPKIANYPFTTIRPQIGIAEYEDYRQIRIADLPGLIEDAHMNVGMGHSFLKHVERTKLLLLVVDIQGFQLSVKYPRRSCLETIVLLNKELELYKPDLLNMPALLILNKMDTENATEIYREIEPKLHNYADCIGEFPEEMQPEKAIEFDQILTASLIQRKKEEIKAIKQAIRDTIDKHAEEVANDEMEQKQLQEKFIEKVKRQTKLYAPTLV